MNHEPEEQVSPSGHATRAEAVLEKLMSAAAYAGPAKHAILAVLKVLSVLAVPHYAGLWIGSMLSNIGTWVYNIALQWMIHEVKNDPRWLGYCALATWLSVIIATPFGGVIADRVNCRRVLLWINGTLMLLSVGMAALNHFSLINDWGFIGAAVIGGLCTGIAMPSVQTLIPQVVGQKHIPNAVALNAIQFNTSRAIGPAIGGWFLSVFGASISFLFNAASFIAFTIPLLLLPEQIGARGSSTHKHPLKSLVEGVKYLRSRRDLVLVEMNVFCSSLALAPIMSLLPVYVAQYYENQPGQYASMLSMFGLGAIVGVPLVASRVKGTPTPWLALPLMLCFGLTNIGLSLTPHFVVVKALAFFAGLFFIGGGNRMMACVISAAPPELRGRIVSLHFLVFSAGMPIGSWLASQIAATRLGMSGVFLIYGVFLAICVCLIGYLGRDLIRKDMAQP
jgi:MFS family permease